MNIANVRKPVPEVLDSSYFKVYLWLKAILAPFDKNNCSK